MNKKLIVTAAGILMACVIIIAGCELGGSEVPPKNIKRPYISVQPLSASYYTGPHGDNSLSYTAPPVLKVSVNDWNSNDGALSYQWYTFENIEKYCTDGGTAIPNATGSTYTPDSIVAVKGNRYYYYVTVTNSKGNALDDTTATLQSEVAVIAFSDPGEPLAPILTRSLANARYRWGAPLNALQIKAVAPDKGVLSYQWYSNSAFSLTDGEAIPLANQTMLIPDINTLDIGPNYFFVIVTNTVVGQTVQTTSIPAIITIDLGKQAAVPRINKQPKDQLYFIGDSLDKLKVDAESVDRGDISYQWYISTTASVKNGKAVPGATAEEFTPQEETGVDISTAAALTRYYYVVVTNTNQNVEAEDKTASLTSKPVKVQVGKYAESLTANAFFTIPNPALSHLDGSKTVPNKYQYIRGYGGMDVAWGNFPRTTQADTELMYDPERLGYNILRIMIRADNIDPAKTISDLLAGDRPDYYNNVKIVNKYGGYVAASPWTPPKDWKSNNSINGGGHLIKSYYKLFASYLRNFAQHMYDNGAPIYVISISNEPNYVASYDGCEWEPEQMRDFFLEVGHFTNGIRGYGGGKETPYVLTMNGESANTPGINLPALQNLQSRAAIDVLARHVYGSRTTSLWNTNKDLITKKDAEGNDVYMEVWMTEHNINSANPTGYTNDSTWDYVWRYLNDIDLVIRMNNENAFVWWASKRFYSMIGDGQYNTVDGVAYPRGYALSHYSRYTIGYTRIHVEPTAGKTGTFTQDNGPGTSSTNKTITVMDKDNSNINQNGKDGDMDNTSPRITAFLSPDGESISMVLWTPTRVTNTGGANMGTMQIEFPPGFKANGVSAHRSTSGTDLFQPYSEVVLSQDRESAFITLEPSQIISVKFTK